MENKIYFLCSQEAQPCGRGSSLCIPGIDILCQCPVLLLGSPRKRPRVLWDSSPWCIAKIRLPPTVSIGGSSSWRLGLLCSDVLYAHLFMTLCINKGLKHRI